MNKVTIVVVTAVFLFIGGCASSGGGNSGGSTPWIKERFYDNNSNYKGYSIQSGNRTVYYNNQSQRVGTSTGGKK
jgi:hypothetical protein